MSTAIPPATLDPPPLESVAAPDRLRVETEEGLTTADFRHRFSTTEFERLHELGFLDDEEERFELLDGDLIVLARFPPPHASGVNRLTRLFTRGLGDRVTILVQNPIVLGEMTQPQPDLADVRFREDGYEVAHPLPEDVLLAIEVMDSTHRKDRGVKLPLYARAGLPETWLVDLSGEAIEVHRDPVDGVFSQRLILRRGQTLAPLAFPDLVLTVESILGRPRES